MIVQGAERPKYGGQRSFVRMRLAHPRGQSQRSGLLCRNVRSWDLADMVSMELETVRRVLPEGEDRYPRSRRTTPG